MFKQHKIKIIISSIITAMPMLFGFAVWNKLPEKIATHWGVNGQPDQYSSKFTAVVLLPLILLAVHLFCFFATSCDKKNKEQNKKIFGMIFWICPCISLLLNGITYIVALGIEVDVLKIVIIFFSLFLIIIGNYMPKCKHNFTIGIRIPTTISSEANWYATHRFAGKLWVIMGLLLLTFVFLPQNLTFLSVIVLLIAVIVPIIYSYRFESNNK